MRLGSRLNSSGPKPMYPNTRPAVASVSATGMPPSSNTKNATSISSASNSLNGMRPPPCEIAADALCERLQEEQREAYRNHGFQEVARGNAAGIGRAFAHGPGLHHVTDRQPDDDQRDG